MNWKMNYWTLLFALAALGLAYQRYAAGQTPKAEMEKTAMGEDEPQFGITDSIAQRRIQRYDNYYAPKVQTFAADSCNTLNGGVLYFGIKHGELQSMVDAFGEADSVSAWLGLIPGNGGAKDTLDLIFEAYMPLAPEVHQYYDFTKPCPPCSGGN